MEARGFFCLGKTYFEKGGETIKNFERGSYSDSSLEDVTEFLLFRTANRWSGLKDVSHQRLGMILAQVFLKCDEPV